MNRPASAANLRDRLQLWIALRWPVYLAVAVALIVWCALDVQRRGRVDPQRPGTHRTDFTAYTEAGAAFFDGRDAYSVTNARGWGYVYPPLFALLVAPLHALDPRWQVTVWFFISVAFAWGAYREGARILRSCLGTSPGDARADGIARWIGWAALAVAILPALNSLQRGQVDLIKLYFVLLGFRLTMTGTGWRSWLGGGVAFAAAIVLKLTPLLPAGFLCVILLVRVFRHAKEQHHLARATGLGTGLALGAAALLLVVPAAMLGWGENLRYLDQFQRTQLTRVNSYADADRTGNTRTMRNQSLSNAVIRLGSFVSYAFLGGPDDRNLDRTQADQRVTVMDAPGVARVLLVARLAFVLLLLTAGVLAAWRGDTLAQAVCFALACAAALVVSPIARGSYFAELAPAVMLLPLWLERERLLPAARVMAWTPAVLVALHYFALPITGRLGVLGLGTTVWCATGLVIVALGARVPRAKPAVVPAPKAARFTRPDGNRSSELVTG